jgi:hypothetical protein
VRRALGHIFDHINRLPQKFGSYAAPPGTAGQWKDFLDYCWNGGNKSVYVVMFSYTQGGVIAQSGDGLNLYISQYEKLVKSTVTHPAVFGYMIGN